MTFLTKLGRKSTKGSFNLFMGIVIENAILALGAIVVGRLLGSMFYGLYTLSSVPASLIGLFAGFGMRNATVKFTAQYNHYNDQRKVKEIVIIGLSSAMLIGASLSIFGFFMADFVATLFGRPEAEFLIQVMSLTIFSNALIIASQSVFVGLERTEFYSFIVVLRALLQASLEPLLILQIWSPSGYGPLGAVVGYALASFATCTVGLVISYFSFIKEHGHSVFELELSRNFKMMFQYGIPLYISRVVAGFLSQFLSVLMAVYATDTLIGNYQVSLNFTILISFFATPIGTVLFPAFSKLDSKDDAETLSKIFKASVKYTSLFVIPATVLVVVLSSPLVLTLYGTTYESAPFFLSLSVLAFLYVGLGQLSIRAVLNGQGETRRNMYLGLANVAVGLPLGILLVPSFGIVGLIVANVVSGIPQVVLGSLWVKKLYNVMVDWIATVKILVLSSAAGLITSSSLNLTNPPSWVQLFIGSIILLTCFVVFAPIINIVDSNDIENLRTVFGESRLASIIVRMPLKIMSKFCK